MKRSMMLLTFPVAAVLLVALLPLLRFESTALRAPELADPRAERRPVHQVPVGISPGGIILDLPLQRLRADLRAARDVGVSRIRVDLSWARTEPRRGRYNWSATDRVIRESRAAGLAVMLVAGYRPAWAVRAGGVTDAGAYGRFMAVAARRYAPTVFAWEIWNEPNRIVGWQTRPDPAAYARVVRTGATAVRRHDPSARIVIGALAPGVDNAGPDEISPITFLRRVYAAGINRSLFDAVSVHPYSYPALPSGQQDWNTFHRIPDLHRVMAAHGDGRKRLWLTEYGAPTGSSSRAVAPERQAQMVVDAYRESRQRPKVASLWIYALRDTSRNTTDPEAGFGLLVNDGRRKPAYAALRRELRGS